MNKTLKIVLTIIGVIFAVKVAFAVGSMLVSAAIFVVVAYVGYNVVSGMMSSNE